MTAEEMYTMVLAQLEQTSNQSRLLKCLCSVEAEEQRLRHMRTSLCRGPSQEELRMVNRQQDLAGAALIRLQCEISACEEAIILHGLRCPNCGHYLYPNSDCCSQCEFALPNRGRIDVKAIGDWMWTCQCSRCTVVRAQIAQERDEISVRGRTITPEEDV